MLLYKLFLRYPIQEVSESNWFDFNGVVFVEQIYIYKHSSLCLYRPNTCIIRLHL